MLTDLRQKHTSRESMSEGQQGMNCVEWHWANVAFKFHRVMRTTILLSHRMSLALLLEAGHSLRSDSGSVLSLKPGPGPVSSCWEVNAWVIITQETICVLSRVALPMGKAPPKPHPETQSTLLAFPDSGCLVKQTILSPVLQSLSHFSSCIG